MKIKKQSDYNYMFIITHCYGSSEYIVTEKSYKEGGYESNYSKAKIGAVQILIDLILKMMEQL